MDMSITRFSPTHHYTLKVERFAIRICNGHINYSFYFIMILTITIRSEYFHHHIQSPSSWQSNMLQQRQIFLLSKLMTDGFPFPEEKLLFFA